MIEFAYETDALPPETEAAMRTVSEAALHSEGCQGDITLLVTGEAGIQALNRDFRHVDKVTDVLTFPAAEGEALSAPPDGYLGDIAICYPRAVEQAEAYGHSLTRELCFLTVHGTLHILGYDHMCPEDEQVMLKKQKEILEGVGVTR
ncbi:MAG: rRNA maturation RNase YbeY [Eubacteriales bacterium]|nr:rRNA maturation RNase YbeY [Eubacteriales bacterium]